MQEAPLSHCTDPHHCKYEANDASSVFLINNLEQQNYADLYTLVRSALKTCANRKITEISIKNIWGIIWWKIYIFAVKWPDQAMEPIDII